MRFFTSFRMTNCKNCYTDTFLDCYIFNFSVPDKETISPTLHTGFCEE